MTRGPSGQPRCHPTVGASGRTGWHAEHYGVAFGMTAPEENVPLMMDQGHPTKANKARSSARAGGTRRQKPSPSRSPGMVPLATLEATIIGYR